MSLARRLALLLALLVVLAPGVASAYTPPPLHGAVNDTASALTPAQRATLESRLAAYRTRTTNEIVGRRRLQRLVVTELRH